MDSPDFTMREVIVATGLTRQLLHTWERRYGVVSPRRGRNDARLYADADVWRLQLLKTCVDDGHRIGRIASLDQSELKRLAQERDDRGKIPFTDILDAIDQLDVATIEQRLTIHFAVLGPARFVRRVVVPLMTEIDVGRESGRMCSAGERIVTSIFRTLLGQGLRLIDFQDGDPVGIFTTPQGEAHEIGSLCAAVLAQNSGIRAVYVGAESTVCDMLNICKAADARLLGLGVASMTESALNSCINALDAKRPRHLELWLGGPGANILGDDTPSGTTTIDDPFELPPAFQRFRIRAMRGVT